MKCTYNTKLVSVKTSTLACTIILYILQEHSYTCGYFCQVIYILANQLYCTQVDTLDISGCQPVHGYICTYMHELFMPVTMRVCLCMYMRVCACVCTCVCTWACVCMHTCTCVCVCVCVYTSGCLIRM